MTWKQFKDYCEAQGLTDEHEIGWIDFSQDYPTVEFGTKRKYANVAGRFETVDEEEEREKLTSERQENDQSRGN